MTFAVKTVIPFTGLDRQYQNLKQQIMQVTDQVLSSGILMNGSYTQQFEKWLAEKNNVAYAVTCHSGTNALEILASYGASKVSTYPPTMLVPSVSYAATANAFARSGWKLHFADVDQFGLIDMDSVADSIQYDGVVLVGLYGASVVHQIHPNYWHDWQASNIWVIEDAAQHWLSADSRRLGSGTAVSFDPMKNLACYGNGGAVLTNDYDLATYAQNFRDNGKTSNHDIPGSNSRMSELDCAMLLLKIAYLDQWQDRRRQIAEQYIQGFADTAVRCLIDESNLHDHAFHKFVISVQNRDQLQSALTQRGIATKIHYDITLPELPWTKYCLAPNLMSVCYALTRSVLSLPIYPELQDQEVQYVIKSVLENV